MHLIKYVTAVLGFFLLGHSIFGAILGFIIGSIISFKLSGGLLGNLSGFGNLGGITGIKTQRQSLFFETVFTLMGKLAKADGRVSEAEIAHVEQFMKQLNMSAEHRKQAIAFFKTGAKPDYAIEPLIQAFNAVTTASPNLKQMLMIYLIRVALADGRLHDKEADLLKQIAQQLGYPPQFLEQLLGMLRGQDQFSGGYYHSSGESSQHSGYSGSGSAGSYTSVSALDAAYQALGVAKTDSDAHIKKTYRKLVREYHPDKLIGQGLPEAMIKEATERSKEIQTAYDLIKKSRGMK